MFAALAIVSTVAALRRSLGSVMPPSTGKLSTGVARRQPLMVRKTVLRQMSSFRQWLLRSHAGAQYLAGAMTMACVAALNVVADADCLNQTSLHHVGPTGLLSFKVWQKEQ